MFNVNPINDNFPSISEQRKNLNSFANNKQNRSNKLGYNQFNIGKILLNNRFKFGGKNFGNNFNMQQQYQKSILKFQNHQEERQNQNLISIEDLKAKDIFSIASVNSDASSSNNNNFEFMNLNVNIDSNVFTINQDSIFNTVKIFILDFFILERTYDNLLHSYSKKSNDVNNILDNNLKDVKEDFYIKFINMYLLNKSNNNLGFSRKSSTENHLYAEANLITKNDLANISKIIMRNFLVYNLKAHNTLQDSVDNLELYCVAYMLENPSVLDKVFEEDLFFKLEILSNKTNNSKLILIKKLVEIILFFVNTIEVNDDSVEITNENNTYENLNFNNNKINEKQNTQKEIKLNFNLIFQNYINTSISEKINNEAKQSQKGIENKLLFNDSNEAFMNKILFILHIFESQISKQIKFVNNNLMKIKLQLVTKLYQMLFLYLFDALIIFNSDIELKKENNELLNLFKANYDLIQRSIRIYFLIFFNLIAKENKNTKEKEKHALFAHLNSNFSDFIFYENFENKIKNMIKFVYCESTSAEEKKVIKETNNPKTLLSVIKTLSNIINSANQNQPEEVLKPLNSIDESFKGGKAEMNFSLLDFNQRKLIDLIKKNSNIN